jgi:acetyl-CoA carboxylase, biotin carboxylase subunit
MQRVFIANRGEIALRIIRACRQLGLKTVIGYSSIDKDAMPTRLADISICIGPASPQESYLNGPRIISAAEITGCDAIHPGYGFLSENADFAEQVSRSGFIFIGPSHENIRQMGNKVQAIKIMRKTGIPCVPGSDGALTNDIKSIAALAENIGYPVLVKASGGGGGRGMAVIHRAQDLQQTIAATRAEAKAAFNNDEVYLEKFLQTPRHIEIQILADGQGNAVHLGERDCSIQRRHQKVIEEAPALGITPEERNRIGSLCVKSCLDIGYKGAGTFEFLYENGQFYFIEMNTRVQVEHPVTEMITGIDIVTTQLSIAAGEPLPFAQKDITFNGHAIECRINAENALTFVPSPGKLNLFHAPGGPNVRFDSHIYSGYHVPHHYDSMIGKLICFHQNRPSALQRTRQALSELVVEGIDSNIALHQKILLQSEFIAGNINIHYLEKLLNSKTFSLP